MAKVALTDPSHPAHSLAGRIVMAAWAGALGLSVAFLQDPIPVALRLTIVVIIAALLIVGISWLISNLQVNRGRGRHARKSRLRSGK